MNVRSIRAPFAFLVALALVTLLRAAPAQAAPLALKLGEGFSSAIVGRSLDLALDVPGTASLDEVLAGKVQFTPSEKDVPSFGYRHGVEWAHLDIASTAWKKPSTSPTVPEGASGFGVRLLNRLVADSYEG